MSGRDAGVTIFCHRLDGRAIPRLCIAIANAMVDQGANVTLLATSADRRAAPSIDESIPVHVLPISIDRTTFVVPSLTRWIRRHRPDVVFAQGNGPNRAAVVAARASRTGTPIVTVEQNHFSTYISPTGGGYSWRPLRAWLTGLLYARADRVAGVSPEVVDDLERRFPGVRGNTTLLPNPGPEQDRIDRLASEPLDHPWFTERDRPTLICSVANVIPRKGHDVLVDALPEIRRRAGDVRAVVIGRHDNPAYLERIEANARRLGVADSVTFPGYRRNPFPYVAGADAFVLPSRNEGAPLVLLEAMACGVPVVAADCPSGPSYLLDRGRAGLLVPMDDPPALAEALVRIVSDRELRSRLIAEGRTRVERFRPARIAAEYLELAEACRDTSDDRNRAGT